MQIQKLNHVHVSMTPDQERAMRFFYEQVFGLTEIPKPDVLKPNGGMWYGLGNIELHELSLCLLYVQCQWRLQWVKMRVTSGTMSAQKGSPSL